jgi:hypothetical protein
MSKQAEFIESLEDELTPDQAFQLLELEEGDTGGEKLEQAAQPGAADEQGTSEDATEQIAAPGESQKQESPGHTELTADNAVVLSKDGKHTIGYEKLVEARQGLQHWKTEAAAKDARIAELEALAKARVTAGEAPTTTDNQLAAAQSAIEAGVDPELFGDFSEQALAHGIQTLVERQVASQVQTQVAEQVGKALEPLRAKAAQDDVAAHYRTIYETHPDADAIAESKELAQWIESQPSIARDAYANVLSQGTAAQVVELFSVFKQNTSTTQRGTKSDQDDAQRKAQEAIAKAAKAVPASLSDIPGGRASSTSRLEQMAEMNPMDLLESMNDMSSEQINAWLNRL